MFEGGPKWRRDVVDRAVRRFQDWELAGLPVNLRRNNRDYYYLSVWPGLRKLGDVDPRDLPARPEVSRYAYFHLPFCSGLCSFCSYLVAVTADPTADLRLDRYVTDLLAEVEIHQARTRLDLTYLYFGGGTPSLFGPDRLGRLLAGLADGGVLAESRLGTVELHPEVFDDPARLSDLLGVLKSNGVNRVSVGFESDDESILAETNRRHRAGFLNDAIRVIHDAGFTANIDLMYGLPRQGLDSWLRSLETVLSVGPDSISTYFTFVDEGTKLSRDARNGTVSLLGHREIQLQHLVTQVVLEDEGFLELPNDFWSIPQADPASFSQDTLPSQSNSIALGAGSYGYYPGVQYFNDFRLDRYAEKIQRRQDPIWRAAFLTSHEELCRDIMFSFKNSPLLDLNLFESAHGVNPLDSHPRQFEQLTNLGLVVVESGSVRLTAKGRLIVEEIACLFAVERPDRLPVSRAEANLVRKHHFAPTYAASSR